MSVLALTDGDVTTRYAYSPFGETAVTGEADDQPFRFTGREWGAETGLFYYRERYMSPTCKRFICELHAGDEIYAADGSRAIQFIEHREADEECPVCNQEAESNQNYLFDEEDALTINRWPTDSIGCLCVGTGK